MGPRVLVVPSNRESCLADFLRAWEGRGGWDEVVVIEDNPEKTFRLPPYCRHFSHKEIAADLGDAAWVISRKDSACRSYGFLAAWRMGASYVLTLDDDCLPRAPHESVFTRHVGAMNGHRRWVSSVPGMRVRGLPYRGLGDLEESAFNVGLWSGVPDLDGRTQLESPVEDFSPPPGTRLVPAGQYFPASGMNVCFARRAVPLAYFALMGEGRPYRRFDDIWMGVVAKKVCDHLRWPVSAGEPFVHHRRASDPEKNAASEAPGVEANEEFWRLADRIRVAGDSARWCLWEVGRAMADGAPGVAAPLGPYLADLGRALQVWAGLFQE